MSVTEIQAAIAGLTSDDLADLMNWLDDYQAKLWDKQIEDDLDTGRLDRVLAEVDKNIRLGWQSRYEAHDAAALLAALPAAAQRSTKISGQGSTKISGQEL